MVIDRYLKIVRFISTTKDANATDLAALIIDNIISKFSVPRSIISDRGPVFTSSY